MVYLFNDKVILISAIIYVIILMILKCFFKLLSYILETKDFGRKHMS